MPADILIVDDEADIRDLVAGILEDEGHNARLARDSDEALRAIEERRPHLVILDIWLQGSRLDGLEVLSYIKRSYPELPVVIISGHGNIETAVTAIKRGAYDYIEKPFKADRLILVTLRALEAFQLKREVKELRERSSISAEMIGKSLRHQPAAQRHRPRRADQQPHSHPRPVGLRQGACGARDPLEVGARGRPLRRAERRRHGARSRRGGAVRHRGPLRRPAQGRRAGRGARRHALHRRDRRHAARDAGQGAARAGRAEVPAPRRQRRRWRSTCASSPPPAATSSARSRKAASARTSTTA